MTRARATNRPFTAALAAPALIVALALAACGGGGSSSSSTSSGPTHAQYVASANAICKTARRQTAPLIAKLKSSGAALVTGGGAALAASVTHLRDIAATGLAKLRALEPPAADRAQIERVLTPLKRVIGLIGAAAQDLGRNQALNAVALIQQAQPLAARIGSAARALGASQCALVLAALS
jgi:hypothetical protein